MSYDSNCLRPSGRALGASSNPLWRPWHLWECGACVLVDEECVYVCLVCCGLAASRCQLVCSPCPGLHDSAVAGQAAHPGTRQRMCHIETGGNRRHAAANVWLHVPCHHDNTATSLAYPILGVCCAINLISCLSGQPQSLCHRHCAEGNRRSCSEELLCLLHFCTAHVAPC